MTRRVLVTGGAGFIGSHLTQALLDAGFKVVVLDNESTGSRENVAAAAEYVRGDVRHEQPAAEIFASGVDVVCHIAGQASIKLSYSDPGHDLGVNVAGTVNMLRLSIAHRVPRFLFASSMTVYGNPTQVPTPESHPLDPVSYYGITKLAAERYVHVTAGRSDLAVPLDVTSLRMFNVYGPGQSLANPYQGVLAIFIGNLSRQEPITICSDGQQSRDFVYISDVTRAWVDCIDRTETFGRVFNLGSGTPTTVNDLCDMTLAGFERSRATHPVHSAPSQEGDVRCSAADVTAIGEAIGWHPQTLIATGLAATIDWAREQAPA